jgi:hypothetical protein
MSTTTSMPFTRTHMLRLVVAVMGAAVLMSRTLSIGLAADPEVWDQPESERPALGALGPDTVALILTTPGISATVSEDSSD